MNENLISQLYHESVKQEIATKRSMEMTSNLSVFIIAGMMYFIFGFPETSSHLVAIIGSLTVFVLQIFEARVFMKNYTYKKRVNEIEEALLKQNENPDTSVHYSGTGINFVYAFAATIWKNYILIFLTLDACWFAKLYLFPTPASSWSEFLSRPESGFIPGWFFFTFAGVFWLIYFSLGIWYKIKSKSEKNSGT